MEYTKAEKNALKLLEKNDFKNISKKKVLQLVSSLPTMDKEVALKVLDQFPILSEHIKGSLNDSLEFIKKLMDQDNLETQTILDTCTMEIDTLLIMTDDPDLSFDQKMELFDRVSNVRQEMQELHRLNQMNRLKAIGGVVVLVGSTTVALLNALGNNARISNSDNSDDSFNS